jgi:UDP-N-acetylglucosamine--N-acetylmuramyl-(pentapeptide) pyrophosphoryl-undecaprenol N-acetylglucosamine transferase
LNQNVLIAAGGTGGHISPGIALAEYLQLNKDLYKINKIVVHSLFRNKDNPDLLESSISIEWHDIPQFHLKTFFLFPMILIKIIGSVLKLRKLSIDSVIAMGGYSCIPSLIYAILFQKKIYLCEQNVIPGNVIRLFQSFAEKTSYSFPPKNLNNIKIKNYKILGNPIRKKIFPEALQLKNKNTPNSLGEKINVLVMGGSQGARQINNMVLQAMENSNIAKHFNFRILTGTNLYKETKEKSKSNIELIAYSQDMKTHYEWANLIIARSGAGVISECLLHGLPMILIPYPYAKDNHQKENALYCEEFCNSIVINQLDDSSNQLEIELMKIIDKKNILQSLTEKSLFSSKPEATKETLDYFFLENL